MQVLLFKDKYLSDRQSEIEVLKNNWLQEKEQQKQKLERAQHQLVVEQVEIEQAQQKLKNDQDQFDATIEAMRNSIQREFHAANHQIKII